MSRSDAGAMHLTVAICTWNRARLLEKTLDRMTEVRPPAPVSWDILVVDNNSTDATADVVRNFEGRLPIRRVVESQQGLSHARNRALAEASGRYILFTDDDVLVGDDWLGALVRGAAAWPDAGGFGGPIEPWFETTPDPTLCEAFPLLARGFCGIEDARPEGPLGDGQEVFGANMAFRVDAIDGLSFDPNLGASATVGREGEEVEFSARLRGRGYPIVWLPAMSVRHYVDPSRMTLSYLRRYYEGRGRTTVRREGVPDGTQLFGVPRWLLRRWLGQAALVARSRVTAGRVDYLTNVRNERYTRGMLKECLAISRERRREDPLRHA